MPFKPLNLRQLHRVLAPIMILPVLLTLITGSLYQIADQTGNAEAFQWLLELHLGNFGPLHLEKIYVYLNATGILVLAITGISMWFSMRRRSVRRTE